MKRLRTAIGYAAMAAGVIVGGVVVGAIVIAPAVSYAKPVLDRTFSSGRAQETEGTGGAVGQADGDPLHAGAIAQVAVTEPFKPMAQVIAAERGKTTRLAPHRRTGFEAFRYRASDLFDDARLAAGRVPKLLWLFADIAAVLIMAGLWIWRRRRAAGARLENALPSTGSAKRSAGSLPSKLVSGKGSRTPKAVAALAEAGNSPADIARRTGLALDAVAMLISTGPFGARQLQPPTA